MSGDFGDEVLRRIEERHPGIVNEGARFTLEQWAEFLRLEHPRFGIKTVADLVDALLKAEPEP